MPTIKVVTGAKALHFAFHDDYAAAYGETIRWFRMNFRDGLPVAVRSMPSTASPSLTDVPVLRGLAAQTEGLTVEWLHAASDR